MKEFKVDSEVIEHMACMEITRHILQPPYHLIDRITTGDKGMSFDGSIDIYDSSKHNKQTKIGEVAIQVKGTTDLKRYLKGKDFKYYLKKADLLQYKRADKGILFFVVAIKLQPVIQLETFYRSLSPLEIDSLLQDLKNRGRDSIKLKFKKLFDGQIDKVCRQHLEIVNSQPKYLIDIGRKKKFKYFSTKLLNIESGENLNIFEEPFVIYGCEGESKFPLYHAHLDNINLRNQKGSLHLEDQTMDFNYSIKITEKEINICIENTLYFHINIGQTTNFNLEIDKIYSLESYYRSLRVLQHLLIEKKIPINELKNNNFYINKREEDFKNEIINKLDDCQLYFDNFRILGIASNYVLSGLSHEDLVFLLDVAKKSLTDSKENIANIINLKEKNGKVPDIEEIINQPIKYYISEEMYLWIIVRKNNDTTYSILNFNDIETKNLFKVGTVNSSKRVSPYCMFDESISELVNAINFDFNVLESSFLKLEDNINYEFHEHFSLYFMNFYINNSSGTNEKFVTLSEKIFHHTLKAKKQFNIDLLEGFNEINILICKVLLNKVFTEEEESYLEKILEENGNIESFAATVLLKEKRMAIKIYNQLEQKDKEKIDGYPLGHLYRSLISA